MSEVVEAPALRVKIQRTLPVAVAQAQLPAMKRLRLRVALTRPDVREAVEDYLEEVVSVEAIGDGDLLKLILDHLPEIIKLIELIVGLF